MPEGESSLQSCNSFLNMEFVSTMRRIRAALQGAPKSTRIRGEPWVQRLEMLSSAPQEEFQRDRNLQAKMLLQCIESGEWTEPYDRQPPEGTLPMLPGHVALALRRKQLEVAGRANDVRKSCVKSERLGSRVKEGNFCQNASVQSCCKGPCSQETNLAEARTKYRFCGLVAKNSSIPCRSCEKGELADDSHTRNCECGHGLASVAAVAVGHIPHHTLLAARICHLQDENKRLLRQLGEVQARNENLEARLSAAETSLADADDWDDAASTASLTRFQAVAAGDKRKLDVQHSRKASPMVQPYRDAVPESDHAYATRSRNAECQSLKSLGPPPPESDTEGFLCYLDKFQRYTDSLVSRAAK